ncbi:VanW family protein [Nocardioides sp.]|uniref:VanW family protein n=1 Tax=Nocardioides sp. TaxID=35761 RepID=UPI00271C33A7|nr:VanW family protein [Nocardioides sp.]MDO9456210.1 VanW family protein [Nocardioides sp.]
MENRDERPERARGRVVLVVALVLVLLVGGGYAAAYGLAGDKLPRGASVAGVDVGGLSPAAAEDALRDGLADRVAGPIEVSVEDRTGEVDPAEAGLEVDYAASVAAVGGGRSWSPGTLWDHYVGGEDDTDAVVRVDDTALDAAVAELATGLGTDPVDGAVAFERGRVVVTDPVPGRGLEPDSTREALVASYLTGERADLEITQLTPDIDDGDVEEAVTAFAEPALSGPVTLRIGSAGVRLRPRQYARALSLVATDGALVPTVDADVLVPLVERATAGEGAPVDARIELVDGRPRIIKAKPGVTFEPDGVADAFLEAVVKSDGERTAKVAGTVQQPDFTTKDARALGVRRQVSEFTTYFPYADYRNVNIGRAAEIVDGTLLKPGEVFSLNDVVGERTVENGFTEGTIISNGIFVKDLGGGVSQMATTTFNAMFYAGLEDIEHKPHSVFIDRYPVGREATVAFGSVDLRFRNDTDYGVLINAELTPSTPSSQGVLTVRMFSTKVWDISEVTSDRYAYVSPGTQTLDTTNCVPNTGYSGFQVDVTRIFRRPGSDEVVRREKFHTDYIANDTVICRPPGSLP